MSYASTRFLIDNERHLSLQLTELQRSFGVSPKKENVPGIFQLCLHLCFPLRKAPILAQSYEAVTFAKRPAPVHARVGRKSKTYATDLLICFSLGSSHLTRLLDGHWRITKYRKLRLKAGSRISRWFTGVKTRTAAMSPKW